MEKTQNYNLNKPESTDPLRVADFNENSDVIDAALGELAVGMPKIAYGTYTGNGGETTTAKTKSINVGFYPKVAFVYPQNGIIYYSPSTYGYKYVRSALATRDKAALVNGLSALTITETGFVVNAQCKTADLGNYGVEDTPATNYSGIVYNYIAIG